jgi:Cu-processing system permease protein
MLSRVAAIAEREFLRAIGYKGTIVVAAAAAVAALALGLGSSGANAVAGAGRTASSLSSLVLMASSLTAILGAALSFSQDRLGNLAALIKSYGFGDRTYVFGKYLGSALAAALIVAAVFAAVLAACLPGSGAGSALRLAATALTTSLVFAAWGAFLGVSRPSALSAALWSIGFWFVAVFAYEAVGWALVPALPYRIAKPALALFLALDPAEALRLGSAFLSGRGSAYGPEFYYWQRFFETAPGVAAALGFLTAHASLPLTLASSSSRRAG